MSLEAPPDLEFGTFRIDREQRLLFSGTEIVPLAPKTFDTLLALVEGQGRIVEKDALLKRVWPDTFVEEGSLAEMYRSCARPSVAASTIRPISRPCPSGDTASSRQSDP